MTILTYLLLKYYWLVQSYNRKQHFKKITKPDCCKAYISRSEEIRQHFPMLVFVSFANQSHVMGADDSLVVIGPLGGRSRPRTSSSWVSFPSWQTPLRQGKLPPLKTCDPLAQK